MDEVYKGEQTQISGVEKEAQKKKYETLKSTLAAKHDVFFDQASAAGKLFANAEKTISNKKGKEQIKKDKEQIRAHLVQVAEKGRTILAAKEEDKSHPGLASINSIASSIKGFVESAKTEIPIYLELEKHRGTYSKALPTIKKALELKDPKKREKMKPSDIGMALADGEDPLLDLDTELSAYRPENFATDVPRMMLSELKTSVQNDLSVIAAIRLDVRVGAEKDNPDLEKLNTASDAYEKSTSSMERSIELKDELLTSKDMSPKTFQDKMSSLSGVQRAAFDELTKVHQQLKQIPDVNMLAPSYQVLYRSLLAKAAVDLQDIADVKLYCEMHDLVGSAEMNKYFVFNADGTVEKTSAFKGLDVWKQEELMDKLNALPLKVSLEMDEKMAGPEEKDQVEGKKKLMNGDWLGAKQDLLKYWNANVNKEGADEARLGETKELLKQVAKLEIAQCAARIQAMRESIEGRYDWKLDPGSNSSHGTKSADQAELYLDDMTNVLMKAQEMIENGEALTIGDAESKLRKMEGTLSTSAPHLQDKLADLKQKKPDDEELKNNRNDSIESKKGFLESQKKQLERAMRGEPSWLTGELPSPEFVEKLKAKYERSKNEIAALEKMTPEQYQAYVIENTQRELNEEKLKSSLVRFNGGFGGASDVFDVFKQQRIINNPDKEKRDKGVLKLAKKARERGLPELAKQYYGMYFEKELSEQSKHVTKADVLKKFVEDEDNRENIDNQLDRWKENFRKKAGRKPTEDEVSDAQGQMVRYMAEQAYSREVKKRVHQHFSGSDSERAKIWKEAYGGSVAIEDIEQEGMFEGLWTDDSWNALPAKVAITTSIIIVSIETGGAALELLPAGSAAVALLGEGAVGRAVAFGADLAVESVVFTATEGALNGVIQGDWSTYQSGGSFLKAWGHTALSLGPIKVIGKGTAALRGMSEAKAAQRMGEEAAAKAAYMPKGARAFAADAGWWAGRTTAEGGTLTTMAWAQSQGKFGRREALQSFGENTVFSISIGIGHSLGKHGGETKKGPEKELKETTAARKAVKTASEADIKASEARAKAETAKKDVESGKKKPEKAKKIEKKAEKLETKAKELETKAVEALKVEARAKAEAEVAAKQAELQQHLDGMCPCHRAGMKSIIDQYNPEKISDPVEKAKILEQALQKVRAYEAAENKNDHIAQAREAFREKLLDPNSVEGKELSSKLDGKNVKVTILNPDGTVKAEVDMAVDKRLLTPDTLMKIAAGEPIELTDVDLYLHKHMARAVDPVLEKAISDPELLAAKRKEITEALAKGEDISKILESISPDKAVREKLEKDLKGAEEKVLQGAEVFTTPHAEMNAEGKNIAKEFMHETVNGVFDKFAADYEKETGKKLDTKALEKIKQRILEAGIDQHIDNPPQYVSHGFDHSLRVMENVRRLLKQTPEQAAKGPPEAISGLMEKYDISRSQAELMTQLVGICHDFGYPTVGDLNKSLHAVTGTYRFLVDIGVPLGEAMGLDLDHNMQHIKLIKNFANSIECHSADKVETSYKDSDGIMQELKFNRKMKIKIRIPNSQIFYYQEFLFMAKDEAKFKKKSKKFFKENLNLDIGDADITVDYGEFEGRYVDAPGSTKKGEIPAGIEFRGAELSDKTKTRPGKGTYEFDPLLALVRYADNLDMDPSRFSAFQRSEVFTHLYERLGAERSVEGDKTLSTALREQLSKKPPSVDSAETILGKTEKINGKPIMYEGELLALAKGLISKGPDGMQALHRLLGSVQLARYGHPPVPLSPEYTKQVKAQIESIVSNQGLPEGQKGKKSVGQLEKDFQRTLSGNIYADEKSRAKPGEAKYFPSIEKYIDTVNEISFRHFGGCNPVEVGGVRVEGSTISIGMRPDVIKQYRGLSAEEKIPKPGGRPGETISLNIPISVYQVWRAVEAYQSVTVHGKRLTISLRVGDKTFTFDPNGRKNPSGEFLQEYRKWEAKNVQ